MTNVSMRYKVLAGCCLAALAAAAGAETRFAVTPLAGYGDGGAFRDTTDGSSIDLEGGGSYALALNMAAVEDGEYELFYSRRSSQLDASQPVDIDVEYLHIGGTTPLGDGARVSPYFGAGVGATRFSPEPATLKDATRWSLSLATGMKVALSEHFGLRFELRGYATWLNGRTDLLCVSNSGGAACTIEAKGDTLLQYEALGGVSFKF